jgi:hypothetical protein
VRLTVEFISTRRCVCGDSQFEIISGGVEKSCVRELRSNICTGGFALVKNDVMRRKLVIYKIYGITRLNGEGFRFKC